MAQDIKRKIVLEGEKEYSAALKEAQRNLKTLRSELKAETAELGANATAQQKSETRIKSLQKQIKEQEKVVKTCQAALAQAKAEYSDNEEVVAKWEQKLNDARATLANMKNDLESTSQAVRDTGNSFKEAADGAAATVTATKSVADAMGQIGSVGESISGAIEGVFFGMIQTIEHAVSAMWDMVTDAAAKANGWEDIAGYWNTDTQTIQQYARAVAASGNAFDQLNSAVSRIVLGGKNKEITEMLQISDANYVNDWEYAIGVLNRIHDLQKEGQDMTPIFQEVFGEKKSTQVMDLLNDWDTITGLLDTFNGDKGGFGLTTEALDSMAALHVQIETVEEKWDALVTKFSDGLGTATGTLLVNVEGGLDAVNNFMNATTQQEREQALEDLRTNVEEFFTKVGDILREGIAILGEVGQELQESDDPVVKAVGKILTALKDALEWIVDNQDDVLTAFEVIFGTALMGHLLSAAGKLGEIVLQIEAIKKFKGFTIASAAEAAGGAAGKSWAAGFGAAAMKALPWLAGLVVLTTPTPTADDQWDSLYDKDGNVTEAGKANGLPATQAEYDAWGDEEWAKYYQQQAEQQAEKSQKARITAIEKYLWRKSGADYTESMYTDEAIRKLIGKDFTGEQTTALNALLDEIDQMAASGQDVTPGTLDVEAMLRKFGLFPGAETSEPLETLEEPERPQGEPKRKKNITGKATEEQMQTRPQEQAAEETAEAVAEAVQTVAATIPETAEAIYDAMYQAINDYDPDTNQLNTTDFFDNVLYPMIQKQAELGGVVGDEVGAIADLIYDKWIQSMYDEEWEGSTDGILRILEEAIEEAAEGKQPEPTDEQKDAAEAFWDIFRHSMDGAPDAFDELLAAFEGSDELLSRLDALIGELENSTADEDWRSIENLPANWWLDAANWQNSSGNNNGITSADLQDFRSLPGNMAAAVQSGAARGVSGIKVVLDGATVGRLVAPYVSETIARDVII